MSVTDSAQPSKSYSYDGGRQSPHIASERQLQLAGIQITPTMAVYAATKNAVRTITEGLRQEAGDKLRVTGISPGFVNTKLAGLDDKSRGQISDQHQMNKMAIPPAAIDRAIAFAIEQPAEVDVNEIVIRPTAQV